MGNMLYRNMTTRCIGAVIAAVFPAVMTVRRKMPDVFARTSISRMQCRGHFSTEQSRRRQSRGVAGTRPICVKFDIKLWSLTHSIIA